GKRKLIVFHEEMKNTASRLTSEAVKDSLLFTDRKRRRFLPMERAQSQMVPTSFFQRNVIRNDFYNGSTIANLGNLFRFDHSANLGAAQSWLGRCPIALFGQQFFLAYANDFHR